MRGADNAQLARLTIEASCAGLCEAIDMLRKARSAGASLDDAIGWIETLERAVRTSPELRANLERAFAGRADDTT